MLAGVDPKTVDLTATGNRLTVKGARTRRAPKDARGFQHTEVVYGPFERTIGLRQSVKLRASGSKAEADELDDELTALAEASSKEEYMPVDRGTAYRTNSGTGLAPRRFFWIHALRKEHFARKIRYC